MRSRHFIIPTLAALAGMGVAQAADDIQIHGFVSQGFLLTKNNALFSPESEDSGTLEFNEIGLNVVATPVDRLRVGVQLGAQDLGDSFNDKVVIDWAYGDYTFPTIGDRLDIGVSAGRFKMGHGLYNDFRDLDMTRTSVFLPMAVYNPRWRDLLLAVNGVGVHGSVNMGVGGSLEIAAYLGNQDFDADAGPIHDTVADSGMAPDSMKTKAVDGGNLTWNTPLDGLRVKYSILDGRDFNALGTFEGGPVSPTQPFTQGGDYTIHIPHYWDNIVSAEYQTGDLTLAGEYRYNYYAADIVGDSIFDPSGSLTIHTDTKVHAAYLSAAYRVHPQVEVLGGWQWSQETTTGDQNFNVKWYAWNAAVRYDIVDHWLVKAEYQWTHGTGLLRTAEQPDGTTEEIWSYFALKTTFDF
jgi:hypothetical protein